MLRLDHEMRHALLKRVDHDVRQLAVHPVGAADAIADLEAHVSLLSTPTGREPERRSETRVRHEWKNAPRPSVLLTQAGVSRRSNMSYPRKHPWFHRMAFGLALASVMFVGRASVAPAKIDPGTHGSGRVTAGGWSGMVDLESGIPLSAGIPLGDERVHRRAGRRRDPVPLARDPDPGRGGRNRRARGRRSVSDRRQRPARRVARRPRRRAARRRAPRSSPRARAPRPTAQADIERMRADLDGPRLIDRSTRNAKRARTGPLSRGWSDHPAYPKTWPGPAVAQLAGSR